MDRLSGSCVAYWSHALARPIKGAPSAAAAALALSVGACGHNPFTTASWQTRHSLSERECLARAMYFESNRSSEEGMTAVGTVVMNRLQSGRYPKTVCGVVGQRNQFADGALSKPVGGRSWNLALAKADAVLAGERHARVGAAMHFHTAGYTFPYRNMAYVVAAGGNVFYEKRMPGTFTPVNPNILVAQAERGRRRPSDAIFLAQAEQAAAPRHAIERPARRPEARVQLASLEEREPRPAAHRPRAAHRVALLRPEEMPRIRSKPERIRLAHLDDEDLPKAARQRSDAMPSARFGSMALASKAAQAQAEPLQKARSAAASHPETPKVAGARSAPRFAAKVEPARGLAQRPAPSAPKALAEKPRAGGGEPLPHRVAQAKPADAAKLGWKRGPDPAPPPDRNKAKNHRPSSGREH